MSARTLFHAQFGAEPNTESFTPGRVNLIGEHIDYSGGMVLPMPVPQGIWTAFAPQTGDQDVIVSDLEPGLLAHLDLDMPASGRWSDYASGALQLARRQSWIAGAARLSISSNLPAGSGLSSSAATIVSVLQACLKSNGQSVSNTDLARHAQAIERDFIGMPCGIMDQMAVIAGMPGHALALNTKTLEYQQIPLPDTHDVLVIHSGVTRKLDDGRYGARRGEADAAAAALGVALLCQMSPQQAERIEGLPYPLQGRARHSWTEHQRVLAAVKAMEAGDSDTLGALMVKAHRSYSTDFEASTPEIDAMVEAALDLGATGARLTGGGFGGCLVVLTEKRRTNDWSMAFQMRFPDSQRIV
ncbi:MAG: galactokinase [Pseudomonadota bacterium]